MQKTMLNGETRRTLLTESFFVNSRGNGVNRHLHPITVESSFPISHFSPMQTGSQQAAPRSSAPPPVASTALPRYLALAYFALIVYASLHPFSGWRNTGISPFIFIEASWPRYWTAFDLGTNIIAYLPLGFFLPQSFHYRHRSGLWLSVLLACLLGSALSFVLESIQTYLPSRVPSNLDLASNSIGTVVGAVLSGIWGKRIFAELARVQEYLLAPAPHIEPGLVLIGLWLLTQLSPETVLFGAGDLRHFFDIPPAVPYAAPSFFAIETGIIVCNTLAIGLTVRATLDMRVTAHKVLVCFFLLALLIRTLAAAILIDPLNAFAWLTPGAGLGLLFGGLLLFIALLFPAPWRIAFAGLSLMAGAVLVNLAPANPYSAAALAAWRQGHFLNFNGLTRLTASFWPFLALPYLTLLGRRS